MDSVNKTLYIPLYGKAYVSKKGVFLNDKKAEEIWEKERFPIKGKSKSRWLAYYMGVRSAVFDRWLEQQLTKTADAAVIHIGCGMDSRVQRVSTKSHAWYDIDFPDVIRERGRYYQESADYRMIAGDARNCEWLDSIPRQQAAIVVMEGVSMYLTTAELQALFRALDEHFGRIALLIDCYTVRAAEISKYKNPINEVGVTKVYGIDKPELLQSKELVYTQEHSMTPEDLTAQLHGAERLIFRTLYAGSFAKKMYRLFEYRKDSIPE